MGNSDSFDLINTELSESKKQANSIYNFDLSGIFRRIGDLDSLVLDGQDLQTIGTESFNERLIDGVVELEIIEETAIETELVDNGLISIEPLKTEQDNNVTAIDAEPVNDNGQISIEPLQTDNIEPVE